MAIIPRIYLNATHIYGSHESGWQKPLPDSKGIPSAKDVIERLDPGVFAQKKLSLLLEDDLMLPLQVELDKKVSGKELAPYLLWKLKRHIPYPTEQIELRFVPLASQQRYLTFSIPKFWVNELFQGLKDRGVQLGFIGGVFLSLLDQLSSCHDKVLLCIYRDFYLMTQLDKKGRMLWFRTRRLPYNDQDQLDLDTWLNSDLTPVLENEGAGKALAVYDFSGVYQSHHGLLHNGLGRGGQTVNVYPEQIGNSNPLDLYRSLVGG
jgi:hypothetical protein